MKDNRIFYDKLLDEYRRRINLPRDLARIVGQPKPDQRAELGQQNLESRVLTGTRIVLEKSKVFLVNGALIEDLYSIPHEKTDYEGTKYLPFDLMFFELMEPVEFAQLIGGDIMKVKAMLFGQIKDANPLVATYPGRQVPDCYSVAFFSTDMLDTKSPLLHVLPTTLFFNPADLTEPNALDICESIDVKTMKAPEEGINKKDCLRLFDLCTNIINYVNAYNVEIIEERRDKGSAAFNARRLRHGKKIIEPLKPVYWIKVNPITVSRFSRHGTGEGRTMDYQEEVIGHFQRYHTKEHGLVRCWVDRYIRGPEDAPFKNNRYIVDRQRVNDYLTLRTA